MTCHIQSDDVAKMTFSSTFQASCYSKTITNTERLIGGKSLVTLVISNSTTTSECITVARVHLRPPTVLRPLTDFQEAQKEKAALPRLNRTPHSHL